MSAGKDCIVDNQFKSSIKRAFELSKFNKNQKKDCVLINILLNEWFL